MNKDIYYVFNIGSCPDFDFKINSKLPKEYKSSFFTSKYNNLEDAKYDYDILSYYIKCDKNDKILEIKKEEKEEKLFVVSPIKEEKHIVEDFDELRKNKKINLDYLSSDFIKSKIYNKKIYNNCYYVLQKEEDNVFRCRDLFSIEECVNLLKEKDNLLEDGKISLSQKLDEFLEIFDEYYDMYVQFENNELYKKIEKMKDDYNKFEEDMLKRIKEI